MARTARIQSARPRCYLFIYLVQDTDECNRYCTVLAYGPDLETAERTAMQRVEQAHLRIMRVDTATPAPRLDPASDGRYLAELEDRGSALQLSESACTPLPAA